jgi:hypothetical protein
MPDRIVYDLGLLRQPTNPQVFDVLEEGTGKNFLNLGAETS